MSFQGVQQSRTQNPQTSSSTSRFAPRPFSIPEPQRPQTQEEIENEAFEQDKFEAIGLQLKEKYGTHAPAEQGRLGMLQAKMNSFWIQRMERATPQPNLLEIMIRNAQTTPATKSAAVQSKLTIGQPNDQYEQEADRVAAQVMTMPNPTAQVQRQPQNLAPEELSEKAPALQSKPIAASITPLVQRQELPEEEESVQRVADGVPQVQPDLESRLSASQSGGSPLPDDVRGFMEPRFGADFSQVRVHTGSDAVQMNQELGAQAFTHGSHIYYGAGKAPATDELTGHELTHVVQQTEAKFPEVQNENQQAEIQPKPQTEASTLIQRQDRPRSTEESLADLEERLARLEGNTRAQNIHLQAIQINQHWQGMFNERMSSYRQTIYRMTTAFETALQGFQAAQVAQAEADALAMQLIGLAATLSVTVGFEWVFTHILSSMLERTVEQIVEAWENPVNAGVTALTQGMSTHQSLESRQRGAVPAIEISPAQGRISGGESGAGSPLQFLSSNLDILEGHSRNIEQAFIGNNLRMREYTDEQWEHFNLSDLERHYQQVYESLNHVARGVESLKPLNLLAQIVERHLWARWIRQNGRIVTVVSSRTGGRYTQEHLSLGSYIEAQMNQLGIAQSAGVQLSESWFLPNYPSEWRIMLISWAEGYNESLANS